MIGGYFSHSGVPPPLHIEILLWVRRDAADHVVCSNATFPMARAVLAPLWACLPPSILYAIAVRSTCNGAKTYSSSSLCSHESWLQTDFARVFLFPHPPRAFAPLHCFCGRQLSCLSMKRFVVIKRIGTACCNPETTPAVLKAQPLN
jgi:hypothetical protein